VQDFGEEVVVLACAVGADGGVRGGVEVPGLLRWHPMRVTDDLAAATRDHALEVGRDRGVAAGAGDDQVCAGGVGEEGRSGGGNILVPGDVAQQADRDKIQAELDAITAELASVDTKIDRYLTAFENGKLTDEQCGQRIDALSRQASQLRIRRDELQDALLTAPQIPTTTNLEILRTHIAETIQRGDQAQVKQLNQRPRRQDHRQRSGRDPALLLPAGRSTRRCAGRAGSTTVRFGAPARLVQHPHEPAPAVNCGFPRHVGRGPPTP
jgi:exonuclease VII small subunit